MRKTHIISAFLVVALSMGACAFADNYSDDTSFRGSVSMTNYDIQPSYMKWYNIDRENFKATFRPLSKDQIKNLSDSEKKQYKKAVKIEKLLKKGDAVSLSKAYQMDNRYIPSILAYYDTALYDFRNKKSQANLDKVAKWAQTLNSADTNGIFPKDMVNYYSGYSAWGKNNYKQALDYLLSVPDKYRNIDDYFWYIMVADSYNQLNELNNAISYGKMVPSSSSRYIDALMTIATAYSDLGNKQSAYQYAHSAYKLRPNDFRIIYRLALYSNNDNEKLDLYHKAKQLADNKQDVLDLNARMAEIYERKVRTASKSITGFYEEPDVEQIVNLAMENELNRALQYRGNDLKAAFMSLNRKVDKILAKLDSDEKAAKMQALEEQRIYELQKQNQLQAQQNQLIQKQNQILKAPSYTYHYSWGSMTTK